jgi:dsRNA-specific ribonuclease
LLAYSFNDEGLLQEALTAAGNCRLVPGIGPDYQGNAALAFIGNAYIQLRVGISGRRMGLSKGQSMMENNRDEIAADNRPGGTNELLKAKAANSILGRKCETSGLADLILPAPGVRVVADSTKATALEAVIGAVLLDGGMNAVQEVVENLGVL